MALTQTRLFRMRARTTLELVEMPCSRSPAALREAAINDVVALESKELGKEAVTGQGCSSPKCSWEGETSTVVYENVTEGDDVFQHDDLRFASDPRTGERRKGEGLLVAIPAVPLLCVNRTRYALTGPHSFICRRIASAVGPTLTGIAQLVLFASFYYPTMALRGTLTLSALAAFIVSVTPQLCFMLERDVALILWTSFIHWISTCQIWALLMSFALAHVTPVYGVAAVSAVAVPLLLATSVQMSWDALDSPTLVQQVGREVIMLIFSLYLIVIMYFLPSVVPADTVASWQEPWSFGIPSAMFRLSPQVMLMSNATAAAAFAIRRLVALTRGDYGLRRLTTLSAPGMWVHVVGPTSSSRYGDSVASA